VFSRLEFANFVGINLVQIFQCHFVISLLAQQQYQSQSFLNNRTVFAFALSLDIQEERKPHFSQIVWHESWQESTFPLPVEWSEYC
jgi:hypothetical protein